MNWEIVCDDVIHWAENYKGPPFMACLCDPPYHLTTEPPTWKVKLGEARTEEDRHRRRAYNRVSSAGFMGKKWDGGDIAYQPATWAALAQHLHPGAWIMAFASSRGWHRLAVAMEDAGLVIQPSIFNWQTGEVVEPPSLLGWATGQSFPKSTRIDTAIDRRAGKLEEREVVGKYPAGQGPLLRKREGIQGDNSCFAPPGGRRAESFDVTIPATALARAWVGHRYGGQVLKNAIEPLILARKPLTVCQKYGKLVAETTFLMEGFLCQFINAKVAEKSLRGQERTLKEASESSVRSSAFLIQFALSQLQDLGQTDMWQLSEAVSILLSIVWLWNSIWDALWNLGSLSTTSMETQVITVLRILRSWLQANTPACITEAVFHLSGQPFNVRVAEGSSADSKASLDLKTSVPGDATKNMEKGSVGESVSSAEKSSIPKVNSSEDQGVFVLLNAAMKAGKGQEDLIFLARSAEKLLESLLGQLRTLSTTNANGVQSESSLRPIICAQKPWTGKRLDCIVETGAGALWVDGGRVETHGKDAERHLAEWNRNQSQAAKEGRVAMSGGLDTIDLRPYASQGRWPANLTLTHSPLDDGDGCHESCVVRRLGEQSGERPSGALTRSETARAEAGKHGIYGRFKGTPDGTHFPASTGTAARFFQQSDWSYEIAERLALADPVRYQAKASRSEREGGLFGVIPCAQCGGLDTETHVNEHGRIVTCRRCDHPTVKPISLNIWLASLLLPPPEYAPRRLLVPFAGSGSEVIAAVLSGGWEEVVGIDNNAEYCQIAEARTRWWQGWSQQAGTTEPKGILKAGKDQPAPEESRQQLELLP